ncbi:hypothetical protein DSECCO2_587430 [anaerobic digester metagenome]
MGESEGIEEDEVEEGPEVRVAERKVPGDGEEGEVGPPEELRDRVPLPALQPLIGKLSQVTPTHDRNDVHPVGIRQGEDGDQGQPAENDGKEPRPCGRDRPVRQGPRPKRPPVPGQAVIDVPMVEIPVDVVVHDQSGGEAEERDQDHGQHKGPGQPAVDLRGQEGARAEEERPRRSEVDADKIEIWTQHLQYQHAPVILSRSILIITGTMDQAPPNAPKPAQ